MSVQLLCQTCDQTYDEKASRVHRSKYCSAQCHYFGRRKDQRSVIVKEDFALIPVLHGNYVVVDLEDADLATHSWYLQKGYALSRVNGRIKQIHVLILERTLGRQLTSLEFPDHEDGDRVNCRRSNIRLASRRENNFNKGKRKGTKNTYKGVSRTAAKRPAWGVQITADGITHCLGTYDSEEFAANIYDQWAAQIHGDFARLNFEYV